MGGGVLLNKEHVKKQVSKWKGSCSIINTRLLKKSIEKLQDLLLSFLFDSLYCSYILRLIQNSSIICKVLVRWNFDLTLQYLSEYASSTTHTDNMYYKKKYIAIKWKSILIRNTVLVKVISLFHLIYTSL